jgi:hypothetical protein
VVSVPSGYTGYCMVLKNTGLLDFGVDRLYSQIDSSSTRISSIQADSTLPTGMSDVSWLVTFVCNNLKLRFILGCFIWRCHPLSSNRLLLCSRFVVFLKAFQNYYRYYQMVLSF